VLLSVLEEDEEDVLFEEELEEDEVDEDEDEEEELVSIDVCTFLFSASNVANIVSSYSENTSE
jgi:hypothetical protein